MFSLTKIPCITLLAALTAASPLGDAAPGKRQTDECAPIHLLVARGSTEQPGNGQLNSLAQNILQANSRATSEAIDYPASLNPYGPSVAEGTEAVQSQLTAYVESCPDSKIVLMGYSQGAQIIGDALCGGDAAGTGPVTDPMDTDISSHVTAIVWYGDPRNVAGKPFDEGTATTDGVYARPEYQSCDNFSDQIASYCDAGDPYCAKGNNQIVHLTYPQRYDTTATEFVNEKVASTDE